MKKNISYREKLLELSNIYKISEIQNYVGGNLGASEWMKIDQARVNSFAEVSCQPMLHS